MTERVLIAGCGYVGSELARRLTADDHAVWGLRRNVSALPAGVRPVEADLGDPQTLQALPDQVDVVVYAASADNYTPGAYQQAYVQGLRNIVGALDSGRHQPRLLLFTSSTGVYGQTDGSDVDETSPTEPASFSGKAMLEGETVVAGTGWSSATVRLAGIYGPGRTRFLTRVKKGEAPILTENDRWTNRIHRNDCAGVLHHLIGYSRANPLAPVYLGVDNAPTLSGEVIRWLADRMDAPTPPIRNSRPAGDRKRPRTNKRCLNKRILSTGYRFEVPDFRAGYGAMIDELGW